MAAVIRLWLALILIRPGGASVNIRDPALAITNTVSPYRFVVGGVEPATLIIVMKYGTVCDHGDGDSDRCHTRSA